MKCLKCESEMKKVKLIGDMSGIPTYLSSKEKGLFNSEVRSAIETYVCPKCGYLEFKAETPSVFDK